MKKKNSTFYCWSFGNYGSLVVHFGNDLKNYEYILGTVPKKIVVAKFYEALFLLNNINKKLLQKQFRDGYMGDVWIDGSIGIRGHKYCGREIS